VDYSGGVNSGFKGRFRTQPKSLYQLLMFHVLNPDQLAPVTTSIFLTIYAKIHYIMTLDTITAFQS